MPEADPPQGAERAALPEMNSSLLVNVWRHRVSAIVLVCVGALLGFGASLLQPVRYTAEARLFFSVTGPFEPLGESDPNPDPGAYVGNQAEITTSMPVLERAEGLLGGSVDAEALDETVDAVAAPDVDLVSVTATAPTASGAVARAEAVATAYRDLVEENVTVATQEVVDEIEAAADLLEDSLGELSGAERDLTVQQLLDLRSRARDVRLQASVYGDGVAIFERPRVPASPSQPRPKRNALVGGVLGLLAAAALALYRLRDG